MEKIKEFLKDKSNLRKLIPLLIIFLAAFLRFYRLGENPPSLNWDEISHGYNAYSILKTGKDEWGNSLPLIFRAYGDYKLPLYIYLSTLPVALFGLNAFSVRLISILSGIGLVWLTYLIGKKVTKNETFSLFGAFLTAVSPWSLFVSRIAVEANLGTFLFAAGIYFLLGWLETRQEKKLVCTALFWGLALYAYNSARILVPLFGLLTLAIVLKKKQAKRLFLPAALFLIFLLPFIGQLFSQSGRARFDLVSLIDQGSLAKISELRGNSRLPKPMAALFYNRPSFFIAAAVRNYLSNLSPKYLFFRGGSHYQFSFPDHELLYLVIAPFLLIGILRAIFRGNFKERLIAIWFFLAFLPSAVTRDAPHVLRSLLILPSPMVLAVLGLKETLAGASRQSIFRGRFLWVVLTLSVLVSFGKWWQDYWKIYPLAYSWAWQYGYKKVATFIKENYGDYQKIFFTKRYGEPHEFLAFYLRWEPAVYQKDKIWDYHANWYWVNGFDKFVFVNDWEIKYNVACDLSPAKGKCLLVTSPGNFPKGWKKLKTINFLDGDPAFEILEP